MRERRYGKGASESVVASYLGVFLLGFVGESEVNWRMGASIIVVLPMTPTLNCVYICECI